MLYEVITDPVDDCLVVDTCEHEVHHPRLAAEVVRIPLEQARHLDPGAVTGDAHLAPDAVAHRGFQVRADRMLAEYAQRVRGAAGREQREVHALVVQLRSERESRVAARKRTSYNFV